MYGTEKQTDRANDIRDAASAKIDEYCTVQKTGMELSRRGCTFGMLGIDYLEDMNTWLAKLSTTANMIEDAKWWIDHKGNAAFAAWDRALNELIPSTGKIKREWYDGALQNGTHKEIESWFGETKNCNAEINSELSVWLSWDGGSVWLNQEEIDNICARIDAQ